MTHSGISIDFETRSPVDLKTCGSFVYFEHPQTKALIASYKIDDAPIRRWQYTEPCPADLRAAIEAGRTISAHNAQFEMQVLDMLADREGWPRPRHDQFRCTAATAAAMSLPRDLAGLGAALGLSVQKDKEGMRLIRLFSLPRRPRKGEDPHGLFWNEPEDHADDFALFKAYCDRDVETEIAADERMVPLAEAEQRLWVLDQKINRRGIRVDRRSAHAALALAEKAKRHLDHEMKMATAGAVTACSQVARLVDWVQAQGVALSSAAKAEITDLLETDDLPAAVRHALELRQEAAKTSVSKLSAMLKRANADGRVRGSFLFHGASTGRWSNTGVNFANMPRPRPVFDNAHPRRDVLFEAICTEDPAALKMLYGDELGRPLHLISDAIRGFITAAPGRELVQADYSGIEGVVIAWLADEAWKLEALQAIIDDPSLPDMYRRTAASIMNMTTDEITKKHPLRQSVGKVSELALGFGGGVPAFYSMSRNYSVKLDALYEPVWGAADEERRERAVKRYENQKKRGLSQTGVLSREAWIACEIIKVGWRAANGKIADLWKAYESAVREAVQNPGTVTSAGKVDYVVRLGFLWARLPSGRCLAYGGPRLKDQVWAKVRCADGSWSDAEVMDREDAEAGERRARVRIEGNTSAKVTVLGVNSTTKAWERYGLYGGLLAENNTQAVARDLLVNGMWKAETAGYPIIATVYDEIIAEVPRGFGDLKAFEKLICELPEWAKGGLMPIPLTAGGWRGKRYRKE
jgi:DNA polymerase